MKKLALKNSSYTHLEKGFREWLDILGYCSQSVDHMPTIVREFLHYLENNGVTQLSPFGGAGGGLQQKHYKAYFNHINSRGNHRRGGGLSNNYLNKHIQALEKFYEYLIHKGTQNVPPVTLRQLKLEKGNVNVLTQEEVKDLFKATENQSDYYLQKIINARDKAMLTIFYGCGLRRNEGANLSIDDINFDTRILHVRKGKNYKERLVPFSRQSLIHLQEWIYDYRIQLIKTQKESALFIGKSGKPMNGNSLYVRLKLLQQQVEDPELQNKDIGLHTLRHSIATHLLENGMELQKIQRFLGHSSLESTQIYTHLLQKDEANI